MLAARQVVLAADAGAQIIVSPDVNAEVIAESNRLSLVSVPGALTPTEAMTAHRAGADYIKIFPGGHNVARVFFPPDRSLAAP